VPASPAGGSQGVYPYRLAASGGNPPLHGTLKCPTPPYRELRGGKDMDIVITTIIITTSTPHLTLHTINSMIE
jgi:hypothetical protein